MNKRRFLTFVLLVSLTLVSSPHVAQSSTVPLPVWSGAEASRVEGAHAQAPHNVGAAIAPDLSKLPLSFVPNAGQTDPAVRFQVHSPGGMLSFTSGEVVLPLPTPVQAPGRRTQRAVPGGALDLNTGKPPGQHRNTPTMPSAPPTVLRLRFEGANPAPEVTGAERLPGIVNYFIGNDPAKWRTNLPTYAGVVYRELYPGIDLRYDGVEGVLKGTYTVAPGTDPSRIRWCYDGAASVHLDEATGDLLIRLPAGAGADGEGDILTERAPVAWQSIDGQRASASVHYVIGSDDSIGFAVGDYDPAHPLILDPTLKFSTYLGGSGYDFGYDIAVDSAGNAYVTGRTWSTDFPTASSLDNSLGGSEDAFVTKLNAAGNALLYSTYLGGSGSETGSEIAVDSSGNAYIVGTTTSSDFPTMKPLDDTLGGGRDGFLAKLNTAGNALVYSTYLGGSGEDYGQAIAVDNWDNAHVTGLTYSTDFPTVNPLYGHSGGSDAFVMKFNVYGTGLFYSTYLGGGDSDGGAGIAVDNAGNAYVTGSTTSTNFPATVLHGSPGGSPYAFVTKLSEYGSTLEYSVWLGGTGENRGDGIAVDSAGNAYVAGTTNAANFPTANPLQAANGGGTDAFIIKLNAPGNILIYSTYLGGSGTETQVGITVDIEDSVYVVGTTGSADFPVVNPLDDTLGGQFDVFVAKLEADGSAPHYNTYLGGSGIEESKGGAVVYYAGTIYVTGSTTSSDFPRVNPLDDTLGGGSDVFVSKITEGTPPVATIDSITPSPAVQGRDTVHFHGSGQDTDESGAYITAYLWTSDIDGPLSTQKDSAVPASELSVGTHTISFKVQDDEVEWSPEVTGTLRVERLPPGAVHTLILVNRQKLEDLYGTSEATQVVDKVNALAAHDSVEGLVVRVENDTDVAAAYAAWDADSTSTTKANAVTAAIKDVIDTQWSTHPNLEYLVIVGDDRVIPFRRVLDQTSYPESNYGAVSSTSTTGAALNADMTLSDDYYTDAVPTVPSSSGWDGHDLYIPDLGTGRLIETPAEIMAQIDAFLASDEISAGNAIDTGYDFITDGAQAMCSALAGDNLTTNCTLIGEHWGRNDFIAQVLNTRHDAISINGHASHYIIGTPAGHTPSDQVTSTDVAGATADHTQAIFYTVGCHSGLNVPPTNPIQPLDTAQALIQHRANYIANTGYGWGGTYSVALSEQLMLDFTEHLVYGQSATVGQALAAAKQEYYLNDGHFDYYDEKIMIESTLYGLPMYRYTTPVTTQAQTQKAAVIEDRQVTELGNGLTINSISYQFPPLTAESTADGLYYTLGGLAQIDDSQPIQPKYTADLSFPTTEAHSVVFKGGVYTDVTSFNPVVAQAINEYISPAEPSFDAPGWYPALLHNMNSLERGDTLVTLLGQFNTSNQTERTYDRLSFDIYYHTTSDDWTEPTISYVQSTLNAGTATITVRANDPSGIHAVVVAYTDGDGTWSSVEPTQDGDSWTGNFPASAETRFFVQVVDSAGNVAVDDNGGLYYQPGEGTAHEIFLPLVLRSG